MAALSLSRKKEVRQTLLLSPLFLALSLLLALAVTPRAAEAGARYQGSGRQDIEPEELDALLDSFFATRQEALHVPGAVFVMVQDGEVVFARGYGYANLERDLRFDPEQTIVPAGSTVKVITAMAVMQLAEQGLVDVHADVNSYLTSLQVPDTFPEPITLHHLLHHTAGLDNRFSGVRARNVETVFPLASFLRQHLPPRVYAPGQLRHYNDFHIALAGLVVQEVSGMPFADYVRTQIFAPLDMDSSFMLTPETQAPRIATGYTYRRGAYEPVLQGNYILHTAPGGNWHTTALDVAHFMIAHLEDGAYGQGRVLQPQTVAEMHRQQFTHHPALPGMAYAFDEQFVNERRLLTKSGAVPGMQSQMTLLPDGRVGWFVASNRYGGALQRDLNKLMMERFFPAANIRVLDPSVTLERRQLQRYSGRYRELIGYASGSFEKVSTLANQVVVSVNDDGSLQLFGDHWQPVESGRFQRENGDFVVFEEGGGTRPSAFYYQRTPYLRIPWVETLPVQVGVVALSVLGSVLAMFLVLTGGQSAAQPMRRLIALAAGLNLSFVAGFAWFMLDALGGGEPPWSLLYGPPPVLLFLLALPLISISLTGALGARVLVRGQLPDARRTSMALVAVVLSTATLAFFAHTWNLLGFQF